MAAPVGEFEHLVLLAVLRVGDAATALEIRSELERSAERSVSRGALYATLDRLHTKGLLRWEPGEGAPARGGIPARRFAVTTAGRRALREVHGVLRRMTSGLDEVLGEG